MTRFNKNLKILNQLTNSIDLKEYSGFGGLHKVMNRDNYLQLKSLLCQSDYQQLIGSMKTAYYTPTKLINFIYKALNKIGFTGGKILEPACGHGAFLFNMPENIIENSIIHAVELDRLSSRIARLISPHVKVLNAGFEQTKFKDNSFDLIIGNPPFGSQKINDQNPLLNNMAIHHYFVAKSISLLKTGGILAMVLPQYCLDNISDHPRNIMNDHGSLISAYRLPDSMFDNAKVTVDVVFYIKRKINDTQFTNLKPIVVNGHNLKMNEYYINNPTHIIGKLDTCNMYNERIGLTVSTESNKDEIYNNLNSLYNNLHSIFQPKLNKLDMIQSLDNVIEKLNKKINSDSSFETDLLKFELEKLNYLKSKFLEYQSNEQALLKSIKTTLSFLK